jgi:hypothetical protein
MIKCVRACRIIPYNLQILYAPFLNTRMQWKSHFYKEELSIRFSMLLQESVNCYEIPYSHSTDLECWMYILLNSDLQRTILSYIAVRMYVSYILVCVCQRVPYYCNQVGLHSTLLQCNSHPTHVKSKGNKKKDVRLLFSNPCFPRP